MRHPLAIAGLLAALAAAPPGVADDGAMLAELGKVSATLIEGKRPGSPAGEHLIGVEIAMPKGWKTYWRSPGETGVPPEFDWSGSENLAAAEVLYPAPRQLADAGGVTLGYLDHVVFPVVARAADPAKPVSLALALRYGVCKDICVPKEASLSLALSPGGDARLPPALAASLDRVPRVDNERKPDDPSLIDSRMEPQGEDRHLILRVRVPGGAAGAEAFLEGPGGAYLPLPERVAATGDEATFSANIGGADMLTLVGKVATLTLVGSKGQSVTMLRLE